LENSVQDIANSIKDIHLDIENIRNSSERDAIDFSRIEILAKQISFGRHPLARLKDGRIAQVYLEMLLNIVRLDPDQKTMLNRIVFIQWLQIQSRIDWSVEELYKECFKISKQSYCELIEELPQEYREHFIVDALITANIAGTANQEIYEYIADFTAMLGIKTQKAEELAVIARVALCQSAAGIGIDKLEVLRVDAKTYSHYIPKKMVAQEIKKLRTIVVRVRIDSAHNFRWKAKQQQKVKADDVIAVYQREKKNSSWYRKEFVTQQIKAPNDGTIFRFKDNGTYYGVISQEADDINSIRAWVKARR